MESSSWLILPDSYCDNIHLPAGEMNKLVKK